MRQLFAFGLWQKDAQYDEPNATDAGGHVHGDWQAGAKDQQRVDLERDEHEGAQRGHANGGAQGANLLERCKYMRSL